MVKKVLCVTFVTLVGMKKIAVIGAGTMGNGIAHVFAQHNFEVHLIDKNLIALEKARVVIELNLDRMIAKQLIDVSIKEKTVQRIKTFTSIKEGVKFVDLVIEAVVEDIEVKKTIFKEIDTYCPSNTIIATNTSAISITDLASVTHRPEQVIGMHFMNPVPLMSLVEVIKGNKTSEKTIKTIIDLTVLIDKIPIQVNDYPGFVANRILMPMINEAIEALHEGVATVDAIDGIMKLGMAHPMGPLQLADYIGLDVCLSILNVLHEGFKNPKYQPNILLIEMVKAGNLGVKSGEGFYDYSKNKKAEFLSKRFLESS